MAMPRQVKTASASKMRHRIYLFLLVTQAAGLIFLLIVASLKFVDDYTSMGSFPGYSKSVLGENISWSMLGVLLLMILIITLIKKRKFKDMVKDSDLPPPGSVLY